MPVPATVSLPGAPRGGDKPAADLGALYQMVSTTATDYWNDSCSLEELAYAIERGAVGATTNPTIVYEVLRKEMYLWRDRIAELVAENRRLTEDEVTWRLIEEMAARAAALLLPIFEREGGRKGTFRSRPIPSSIAMPPALPSKQPTLPDWLPTCK